MTENSIRHTAREYLYSNPIHHMDMLQVMERGTSELLYADADGVLLYETASGAHMITAENRDAAARMLEKIPNAILFSAHQEEYLQDIERRFGLRQTMTCMQAVWLRGQKIELPPMPFDIFPLDASHLKEVEAGYPHKIRGGYLAGRIAAGEMFGAFEGERLIAFIGLHEEASIGMLEVNPDYRRKGVGMNLIAYLTNMLLSQGKTPFLQFETGNSVMYRLTDRLGFTLSDYPIYRLETQD